MDNTRAVNPKDDVGELGSSARKTSLFPAPGRLIDPKALMAANATSREPGTREAHTNIFPVPGQPVQLEMSKRNTSYGNPGADIPSGNIFPAPRQVEGLLTPISGNTRNRKSYAGALEGKNKINRDRIRT